MRISLVPKIVALFLLASPGVLSQTAVNPSVALASNGTCAVSWNASPAEGGGVTLLLCDSAGSRRQLVRVNAGLPGIGQNAAVCFDGRDRLTIVWEQWISSSARVLIARYSTEGALLAPRQCVADDTTMNAQVPRLALAPDGAGAVVWLDYRLGHNAVYLQRFTPALRKAGKNVLVAGSESILQTPAVALAADGGIACVWQATMADSFHVCLRTSTQKGRWLAPVIVDDGRGKAYASTPDIAALPHDAYAVVWKDYRSGESDIYSQVVDGTGKRIGPNVRVNDDTTRHWQRLPRIAAASAGILLVWEDYRDDPGNQLGDIYGARMSQTGRLSGTNFRVNASPEPTIQRFPAVGMNHSGGFSVVWCDSRSAEATIFLRRGALDRGMTGAEWRVGP